MTPNHQRTVISAAAELRGSLRPLTREDADAVIPFLIMAAFPPGHELPPDALKMPHAARWIDSWSDELGVGWDRDGELLGAAWARHVEPVICYADDGSPLPEVIVAVSEQARGRGLGQQMMSWLIAASKEVGDPGLSLTVSERNPGALHLYETLGFIRTKKTATGLIAMTRMHQENR